MAANIFRYVDVASYSTYNALESKDGDTLYGIQDTQQMFFGSNLIADKNVFFSESAKPSTAGRDGCLYVVKTGNDAGVYRYDTTTSQYVAVVSFGSISTTTIRAAESATDTVLPTEKAVRTELDLKLDAADAYVHPDIASGVTAGTSYNKVSFDSTGHVATASAETTLAGLGLDGDAYTKTEVDGLISGVQQAMEWKPSVANYAAIATTYATPSEGWTVSTDDDNCVYRYDATTSTWVNIFKNTNDVVVPTSETGARDGLMTAAMAEKLKGIATGAEVNQNAFSTIAFGSSTVAATGKTDTLTLSAGTNITLEVDSEDATGKTVKISGPSSYTHPSIASGVTAGTSYNKVSFDSTGHVATASAETTMSGLGITGTSADITAMSSYAMGVSGGALATTDTLNQAMGKLEYRVKAQEDALTQSLTSTSTTTEIPSAKAVYDAIKVVHM